MLQSGAIPTSGGVVVSVSVYVTGKMFRWTATHHTIAHGGSFGLITKGLDHRCQGYWSLGESLCSVSQFLKKNCCYICLEVSTLWGLVQSQLVIGR